jgi:hypothetical protein
VLGYVGGMVMERSHRPPEYGEVMSRGPLRTASHVKRSDSLVGPRCRTDSLGVRSRSVSSWVRRFRAVEEEGLDLLEDMLTRRA